MSVIANINGQIVDVTDNIGIGSGSGSGTGNIDIPEAATETPKAPGTAAVGTSTSYARADHVHPAQSIPAAATAAPKAPGTAAVGTSTKYAREDHVHPKQTSVSGSAGSCTGNAATATKLATARTINGVAFDGSANITVGISGSGQAWATNYFQSLPSGGTWVVVGGNGGSINIVAYPGGIDVGNTGAFSGGEIVLAVRI